VFNQIEEGAWVLTASKASVHPCCQKPVELNLKQCQN